MLALRFDIDSRFGLVDRTPRLLQLLDRYGVHATFFCVMGRDPQLLEGLYYRYLRDEGESRESLEIGGRGGIAYLLKHYLVPRSVPRGSEALLRSMVANGHEVQPHGWIHIHWQRGLQRINVRRHVECCTNEYQRVFGVPPVGFASPGRNHNDEVLRALEAYSYRYAGDMDGDRPFRPENSKLLQIPITTFRTLAQLQRDHGGVEAAAESLIAALDARSDYCCLYDHPDGMGPSEFAVLERLLNHVRRAGITTATHSQIYAAHDQT